MSFETKLNKLVNKIYKNCVFRDCYDHFRNYALDSRVLLKANFIEKTKRDQIYTGVITAELQFKDSEQQAKETYEFFEKHRKNVKINVYNYYDYCDYNIKYDPIDVIKCADKTFGLKYSSCCHDFEDFENTISQLYLTHDIMMYDVEVKNNPGFVALAEHGFKITHNYCIKTHETTFNAVELTPGRLKEFFEEVYDKIDEVAKNPLYEEYKKFVIDVMAQSSIDNYDGTVNVDVPPVSVYDFVSWKRKVYDVDRDLEQRTADAQKYIDIVQNRVKEKMESN